MQNWSAMRNGAAICLLSEREHERVVAEEVGAGNHDQRVEVARVDDEALVPCDGPSLEHVGEAVDLVGDIPDVAVRDAADVGVTNHVDGDREPRGRLLFAVVAQLDIEVELVEARGDRDRRRRLGPWIRHCL